MNIGFIGIGNMGGAMANWIPKAGYSLVVHDLSRENAEPLLRRARLPVAPLAHVYQIGVIERNRTSALGSRDLYSAC